jgi:HD-GYP domain-containing protein (c-di-GMP phosphodiesterase class II)
MPLRPDTAPPTSARSEVLAALSCALDLVEGQPPGHAVRSSVLGLAVADRLGLDQEQRQAVLYALLLKDAGCSSSSARMSSLFGTDDLAVKASGKLVDWSKPAEVMRYVVAHVDQRGSRVRRAGRVVHVASRLAKEGRAVVATRCERGADVVRTLELPEAAARAVRELDEHMDGSGHPYGLAGDAISSVGRVAAVAQNTELFFSALGLDASRAMLGARRGWWFDEQVVDAALSLCANDLTWTLLVVDAKSPYTASHSRNVAALS